MAPADPSEPGGPEGAGGPEADVTDQAAAERAAAAGPETGAGRDSAGRDSAAGPETGAGPEPGPGQASANGDESTTTAGPGAGGPAGTDPVTGGDAATAEAQADAAAAAATAGGEDVVIETEAAAVEVEGDLDRMAGVARERDDYLDALRRLQADFENYKKRVAKQQADIGDRAAGSLVEALLPALDNADLALAHGAGEGVKQIWDSFNDALGKAGLERIDTAGAPFDPTQHDAVAHEPGDGAQEVAEVLRAGYRWRGRVIRPAMVRVRG